MGTIWKVIGVCIVAAAAIYLRNGNTGLTMNFDTPPTITVSSVDVQRIETHEFVDLFKASRPTDDLAVAGHYTVVEGYIDACGICKVLESKFSPFLASRPDVVIRRVHLPESGRSMTLSSNEEYLRLGLYRNHHLDMAAETMTVCGTPHVEIYGPDRQLIATDQCSENNDKSGLQYLNAWIATEI